MLSRAGRTERGIYLPNNMNTYNLRIEIRNILRNIEEGEAELTPEVVAELDRLSANVHDQFNNLYRMIRHAAVCETALRNESNSLTIRARRWAAVQERLRDHAKELLAAMKIDSYETEICRVRLCQGPPVVKVQDGFNINSLAGTKYAALLETTVTLLGSKVKQIAADGGDLPPEVSVVPGPSYIRL